ncbi:MAG: hypothetical protein ACOCP9_05875 [Halofilum sp. (in: g-proteobacteria)]
MAPVTPDARLTAAAIGLAYALGYLYALGDLSLATPSLWSLTVGDPTRWLDQRIVFQFEGIAMLQAGYVVWLISPLNLLIATILGVLLALNIDGGWMLWKRPAACGIAGHGGGVLAAVPALAAGGACCAPSLLLMLGIPGLGAFAAMFAWLVPLSVLLLGVSRWWQRRQGAPRWFEYRAG